MPQIYTAAPSAIECVGLFQGREMLDPGGTFTLLEFVPPDECVTHCLVRACAINVQIVGTPDAAAYVRSATFRVTGGAATQIGTTTDLTTHEVDAAWDLAIQSTGPTLRLIVTPDFIWRTRWTWRVECTFAPIADLYASTGPLAPTNVPAFTLPTF